MVRGRDVILIDTGIDNIREPDLTMETRLPAEVNIKMTVTTGGAADSIGPGGKNVLVDLEDGIAWVTLNRPDKRNAINPGIVYEMVAALDALEADDRAQVVVITGAGE